MRNLVLLLVAAVLFLWSPDGVAEDLVYNVVGPVPFAEGSGATGKVKAECTLDTRLPQFIAEAARRGIEIVIGPAPEEARTASISTSSSRMSWVLAAAPGAARSR